jgi:hypothetical protein
MSSSLVKRRSFSSAATSGAAGSAAVSRRPASAAGLQSASGAFALVVTCI